MTERFHHQFRLTRIENSIKAFIDSTKGCKPDLVDFRVHLIAQMEALLETERQDALEGPVYLHLVRDGVPCDVAEGW